MNRLVSQKLRWIMHNQRHDNILDDIQKDVEEKNLVKGMALDFRTMAHYYITWLL